MPKKSKTFYKKKIAPPQQAVRTTKIKFPSISLSFPDPYGIVRLVISPVFLASFISGFFIMAIFLTFVDISSQYQSLQKLQTTKEALGREYSYWQQIVNQHEGYRDGYFRLAISAYKLGKSSEAREAVQKALRLDPSYEPALSLLAKIEK